jgi:hypothetical protein
VAKDKSAEDTISEQEYTAQMKSASTAPENDSPGDSETDSGDEFEMGLTYVPDPNDDPEEITDDSLAPDFADTLTAKEFTNSESIKKNPHPVIELPETAVIVSSDQPAHWMDRESPSDTH